MKTSLLVVGISVLAMPFVSANAQEVAYQNSLFCPEIYSDLKQGADDATTNDQVSELQLYLQSYYDVDVYSSQRTWSEYYFGPETKALLVRYQKDHKLPAKGVFDQKTRDTIARECEEPMAVLSPSKGKAPLKVKLSLAVSVCNGSTVYLNWGDGREEEFRCKGKKITKTHTYKEPQESSIMLSRMAPWALYGLMSDIPFYVSDSKSSKKTKEKLVSSDTVYVDSISEYANNIGKKYKMNCPRGFARGSVWGTGTYTNDSSVCTAALHAGVIKESGGKVTVVIKEGLPSYTGSTKNGVTSTSYGPWHGSFSFVK